MSGLPRTRPARFAGTDARPARGGLANEVRYWAEWVLQKVKAKIGDLYPLNPDPEYSATKERRENKEQTAFESMRSLRSTAAKGEVPPGCLMPVAYLWTRTVTCKNPHCRATVPPIKQTWLCKKARPLRRARVGRSPHSNTPSLHHSTPRQVRFEPIEARAENGLGFDPAGFSKAGNKPPTRLTVTAT
jgi:putative DNA methylase